MSKRTRTPVHLNKAPTQLYVAKTVKGAAALVVTEGGPMQAKQVAEHYFKRALVSCALSNTPLICPDARLVDKLVDGAREVMARTQQRMVLYRFTVTKPDKTMADILVWTDSRLKAALAFAEQAVGLQGAVQDVQYVQNPVLLDRSNVDNLLVTA